MERVCQFLKEAGVYYLATVEGDQRFQGWRLGENRL